MNDERFESSEPLYAERDENRGYENLGYENRGYENQAYRPFANAADPAQPRASGGSGWRLLTLVALLAVLALAWFAWQQQQRLQVLNDRFAELRTGLDSTGETLNESGATLGAQLKEQRATLDTHWAEIKKLWALSNERNRPAIEEQGKKLARLEAELKKLQQEIGGASGAAREASAAATAVKTQIAGLAASVDAIKRDGLADAAAAEELKAQVRQARATAGKLEEQVGSLRDSVARSTAENRKALASIDTFRRETNLQLQVLREQLATP